MGVAQVLTTRNSGAASKRLHRGGLVLFLPLVGPAMEARPPLIHGLFQDGMVIQREVPAPIWGWTDPGGLVELRCREQMLTAVADAQGRWQSRLGPFPAGGPWELSIQSTAEQRRLWFLTGDVFLCAGQSNMAFPLGQAVGGTAAVAVSQDPELRLFRLPQRLAFAPCPELPGGPSAPRWRAAGPDSTGGFSAVAYFFAKTLRRDLGVPVGLIQNAVGGSPAEAWLDGATLSRLGIATAELARVARIGGERRAGLSLEDQCESWWRRHDPVPIGELPGQDPRLDDAGWARVDLPTSWPDAGLGPFRGIRWLRRTVAIPGDPTRNPAVLDLGEIGNVDTVWINGIRIGWTNGRHHARCYQVPAGVLRPGENLVAIRVLNHGLGGFFGPGPLQLRGTDGSVLGLAGPWRWRSGSAYPTDDPFPGVYGEEPFPPTMAANGMLAPLTPFACKAVLWYQGEAHVGRAEDYRRLLPALIAEWRGRFQAEIPFLVVQLPKADAPGDRIPGLSSLAEIREIQALTVRSTPRTALAVTIDAGDPQDGHPKDKRPVGERLARLAETGLLGLPGQATGPEFSRWEAIPGGARIHFRHTGRLGPLDTPLRGFLVAGEGTPFVPGEAVIADDAVIIHAPTVPRPRAVRYAWANAPEVDLTDGSGLPAAPFRTDPPAFP